MRIRTFLLAFFSVAVAQAVPSGDTAARPYDVAHYRIQIALDPEAKDDTFTAETQITFTAKERIEKSIELDAVDLTVEKAFMVKPTRWDLVSRTENGKLTIDFPGAMKKGDRWTVGVRYQGKIRSAHEGLFRVPAGDGIPHPVLATQFEADHARKVFPSNDQPFDKATSEVLVAVPEPYEAISNGALVTARPTKMNGKKARIYHWALKKPHPCYLVAFAVGQFDTVRSRVHGTDIAISVSKGQADRTGLAMDATKASLEYFEKHLGVRYPWPRYGIVGIPTFLWGGMENTTTTFQNEERTLLFEKDSPNEQRRIVDLTAHELAHQWFGDFVTAAKWEELWLNEAFASFLASDAVTAFFKDEEQGLRSSMNVWEEYFEQEAGPRSRPLVADKLGLGDDPFDAISYTKGEQILRMLRAELGTAKFEKGIQAFLQTHAYANATHLDMFRALEKASGRSLTAFKDAWFRQAGYPVVKYAMTWDAAKKTAKLTLSQTPVQPSATKPFPFTLPVAFHRKTAPAFAEPANVAVTGKEATLEIPLPAEPEWVSVNVGAPVLAEFETEKRDVKTLALQAKHDPDPYTRMWAARELLLPLDRGGDLEDPAIDAVAAVVAEDPDPAVRSILLEMSGRLEARWMPGNYGKTILRLAKSATTPNWLESHAKGGDGRQWRTYRTALLGALGRVDDKEALAIAKRELERSDLNLEDLTAAALAVARQGRGDSVEILRAAEAKHGARGYRYRSATTLAMGALERPGEAVKEIERLMPTVRNDWLARLGWVVRDNETLRKSDAWPQFLRTFIVEDQKFGDEVKSRLLDTIEDLKNASVSRLLESLEKDAKTPRLREAARKIREKNFPPRQVTGD